MPVRITKSDGKYRVSTPSQVHAKGTTKKNAERQARLLRAIDHGWHPTGKPAKESVSSQAQSVVNKLLEVDEIGSLPIPASGKAYARIKGMRGLRNKQNLYINMSRDLGNQGKSTKGFPNREGSAFTGPKHESHETSPLMMAWHALTGQLQQLDQSLMEPGEHEELRQWWDRSDWMMRKFAQLEVRHQQRREGLERHHTERTKFHGGAYGKGVDSKGKTSGKFKMPDNWTVGHAIKS